MEINWTIIVIVAFCIVILVIFLIWKNWKDKKELTKLINEEYKNINKGESDLDDAEKE